MKGFSKDLSGLMQFPKEGIFSTVLAKSGSYNHTLMCLSAGTDIETHTSAKAGGIFVIQGIGTFDLDGKKIEMNPGKYIFMEKDAPHSLSAETDLAMILFLTKAD